jgi:hypothetical protein
VSWRETEGANLKQAHEAALCAWLTALAKANETAESFGTGRWPAIRREWFEYVRRMRSAAMAMLDAVKDEPRWRDDDDVDGAAEMRDENQRLRESAAVRDALTGAAEIERLQSQLRLTEAGLEDALERLRELENKPC